MMKPLKHLCILLIAVVPIANHLCQQGTNDSPGLYPVEVNGRWGYINTSGKMVIKPRFFKAYPFSNGLGRVKIGGALNYEYGFVNKKGEVVLKRKEYVGDFHEGLAAASADGGFGFIDKTGEWAIEPRFQRTYNFFDGLAAAYIIKETKKGRASKGGFINKQGDWVINPQYAQVRNFSDGLAPVVVKKKAFSKKWAYINKEGRVISRRTFDAAHVFHDGLAAVAVESKTSVFKEWGYINTKGLLVISFQFRNAGGFSNGLAPVQKEGGPLWGYINTKGELVFDELTNSKDFTFAGPFRNGIARVALQGSFSKSLDGTTISYVFSRDTKFVFINKKGEQIWPRTNEGGLPSVTPPGGYQVFHASWPSSKISVAYPGGWVAIDLNKFLNPVEGVSFMKNKKEAKKHKNRHTSIYTAGKVRLGTKDNILISLRIYPESVSDLSPEDFLKQHYKSKDGDQSKSFFSSISFQWRVSYLTGRDTYFMRGRAKSKDDFDVRGEIIAEKLQNRIITISSFATYKLDRETQRDMMIKMLKHLGIGTQ